MGYVKAGEWINYSVNVVAGGSYNIGFRVGSAGKGGSFHLEQDVGTNTTGAINVGNTGGWQTWQTVNSKTVQLNTGPHIFRLVFDSNGSTNFVGNIDNFTITPVLSPPPGGTSTAYNGVVPSISKAGTATIEAENYDSGGEGVAYHDSEAQNLGNAYRTSEGVDVENASSGFDVGYIKAGEWLNYSVNVVDAGAYNLGFRVASGGKGGAFHLEQDAGSNTTGAINVGNTGGWQNWQTVAVNNVQLSAGTHTFRLVFDSNGSTGYIGNLDNFTLTAASVSPPPGGVSTPHNGLIGISDTAASTFQIEDYDDGGEGVAYHDTEAQNLGGAYRTSEGVDVESNSGGFDVGYTKAGEWMNYSVNVAASDTYNIAFRVASAGKGGTFHLEQDPGNNVTGTVNLPNTNGWQTWNNVTVKNVQLTAGTHTFRLVMDSVGGTGFVGNMDSVTITPTSLVPPPPPPPPPAGITVGANKNVAKMSGSQAETTIAINPANPNNIVVVALNGANAGNQVMLSRSTDGGNTWTSSLLGGAQDGVNANTIREDPHVAFDSYGNCYVAYVVAAGTNEVRAVCGRSSNGGASFSFVTAAGGTGTDADGLNMGTGPDGSGHQVVYISYSDYGPNRVKVAHATATALGQWGSFSTQTVSSTANGNESSVAIGPNGEVAVVWQNPDGGTGPSTLFIATSSGGTMRFRRSA